VTFVDDLKEVGLHGLLDFKGDLCLDIHGFNFMGNWINDD
jgi:hypothetical protein